MVNLSLLLALSAVACASAIPTAQAPDTTSTTEPFSFSTWIEGIIADPDGTHLTPEEAVAAKQASVNASTSGGLQTRGAAWCRDGFTPASVSLNFFTCPPSSFVKQNCVELVCCYDKAECIVAMLMYLILRPKTQHPASNNSRAKAQKGNNASSPTAAS